MMNDILPKEVREGLEKARKSALCKSSRLRVKVGDATYPILRFWNDGFALDIDDAPNLRGLVDIFEGSRHIYQCLVVAYEIEEGEMHYEFKRATAAHDAAPLDFAKDENAPVALIAP